MDPVAYFRLFFPGKYTKHVDPVAYFRPFFPGKYTKHVDPVAYFRPFFPSHHESAVFHESSQANIELPVRTNQSAEPSENKRKKRGQGGVLAPK